LTFALSERFPDIRITRVDVSQAYLDLTRSQTTEDRIEFKQADATALPYPDETFDCALSLLVLNLIPNTERAQADIAVQTSCPLTPKSDRESGHP